MRLIVPFLALAICWFAATGMANDLEVLVNELAPLDYSSKKTVLTSCANTRRLARLSEADIVWLRDQAAKANDRSAEVIVSILDHSTKPTARKALYDILENGGVDGKRAVLRYLDEKDVPAIAKAVIALISGKQSALSREAIDVVERLGITRAIPALFNDLSLGDDQIGGLVTAIESVMFESGIVEQGELRFDTKAAQRKQAQFWRDWWTHNKTRYRDIHTDDRLTVARLLLSDPHPEIRTQATRMSDWALPAIAERLGVEDNAEVRQALFDRLCSEASSWAIPSFAKMLTSPDEDLRRMGAHGLDKCLFPMPAPQDELVTRWKAWWTAHGGRYVVFAGARRADLLVALLSDPDSGTRSAAAGGVKGCEEFLIPVLARLANDPDQPQRSAYIAALGKFGFPAWPDVVDLLKYDLDADIRMEAAKACEMIAQEQTEFTGCLPIPREISFEARCDEARKWWEDNWQGRLEQIPPTRASEPEPKLK